MSRSIQARSEEAAPATGVGVVAKRVLARRLLAIPDLLRAAAAGEGEPVHALRVATRRARAALAAFAELVRAGRSARIAKRLRHLRRAAGEARDLDLLIERLRRGGDRDARDGALAALERDRRGARRPLARLARKFRGKRWRRDVDRLLATIRGRAAREPFARFSARRLRAIHARFAEAVGRVARGPRRDLPGALHALRIRGKKTRYATEILAVHAPAAWRRACLDRLERFQDLTGVYTDHARAAERLRGLEHRAGSGARRRACGRLADREEAAAKRAIAAVVRRLPRLAASGTVPATGDVAAPIPERRLNSTPAR